MRYYKVNEEELFAFIKSRLELHAIMAGIHDSGLDLRSEGVYVELPSNQDVLNKFKEFEWIEGV